MKKPRIYVDTSVFGGVFDDEFKRASVEFFKAIHNGLFVPVISSLVQSEMAKAPKQVRDFFESELRYAEFSELNADVYALSKAYLEAGIVSKASLSDTVHVASATVFQCEVIVSWNFKHIVNYLKIPLYNAINVNRVYDLIAIYSPLEVVGYEK